MEMTIEEKIRTIMRRKDMTINTLAEQTGQSRQRIHQAFRLDSYNVTWLAKVAEALGCKVEISFIDKETGEKY